jgi:chromosome segregation ATPase
MKENLFHSNCTAHQSRNHILEFVNYDLSLTFEDLMTPEKREIATLESKKAEYAEAIQYLEQRKNLLESQDEEVRNAPEVKELVEAISEEIDNLKKGYFENQSKINSLTKVNEGVGANVGDTAEYLKKK